MRRRLTTSANPLLLAMMLTGSILILSGCVKTMASNADNKAACIAWPYTPWADADTDLTIMGNKANNAAKKAFCGGEPKNEKP